MSKAKIMLLGASAIGAVALLAASGSDATAEATSQRPVKPEPARVPGFNPDRNAYFGDLHVHTHLSFDAYIFNVRRTPDDAYRFARGEAIGHAGGYQIRLAGGPLDFAAVTDHAEYLGVMREAENPDSPISKVPFVQGLMTSDATKVRAAFGQYIAARRANQLPVEFNDPAIGSRAWQVVTDAAARHYQPGKFTTFIGYEYTSAPDGRNLHRNVIFKGGRVAPPFSANDSADPEDLWKAMDGWRAKGIEALAIPHNSNGSDGLMFDSVRLSGKSMDKAYAELRSRNEPLVEISQIKGTSETHPTLSPNDEWANFEIMESYIGTERPVTKFAGGYVRRALMDGILRREQDGFNPFKFGFISSSDTHNAAPGTVEEPNYFSKTGLSDSTPEIRGSIPPGGKKDWSGMTPEMYAATKRSRSWGASGLVGVWAEQNTRDAIYAAFRRKETFATSGPRIKVRFFAGYDVPADLFERSDTLRVSYAKGVPMGSDLLPAKGRAPSFVVWAVRDPRSGFLQRAQIVKGWVENGQAREQVFDVACSDGLKVDPRTNRCPANGAGVNMATCEADKFKGDVELRTVWRDPGFDPKQRAFYYVRVLENPSCRWSTWEALRNGTPPNPQSETLVMERAWSSPIWYEPLR